MDYSFLFGRVRPYIQTLVQKTRYPVFLLLYPKLDYTKMVHRDSPSFGSSMITRVILTIAISGYYRQVILNNMIIGNSGMDEQDGDIGSGVGVQRCTRVPIQSGKPGGEPRGKRLSDKQTTAPSFGYKGGQKGLLSSVTCFLRLLPPLSPTQSLTYEKYCQKVTLAILLISKQQIL